MSYVYTFLQNLNYNCFSIISLRSWNGFRLFYPTKNPAWQDKSSPNNGKDDKNQRQNIKLKDGSYRQSGLFRSVEQNRFMETFTKNIFFATLFKHYIYQTPHNYRTLFKLSK